MIKKLLLFQDLDIINLKVEWAKIQDTPLVKEENRNSKVNPDQEHTHQKSLQPENHRLLTLLACLKEEA